MTFRVDITSDLKRVRSNLRVVQRRQIPFATSQALNSTAFDVRSQIVRRTWPDAITERSKRLASAAFRVEKATKRKLTAAVFDRLKRAFFELQIEGGTKQPFKGRNIAVPTAAVKRTKAGKVSAAHRPRRILSSKRGFKNVLPSGHVGIFRRKQKKTWSKGKRLPIELMFALYPQTKVKRAFKFYEDGQRVALRKFSRNLDASIARALVSAR